MTLDTADTALFTFAKPTDLILEIPPTEDAQKLSLSATCYQAYINNLCLSAILPWLQEDFSPQAQPAFNTAALPSIWEFVNGCAISVANKRFILIPSEAIDISELRVPQEWIDIPSWVGDYYLAVQIEPDAGWVRVWGYSTHEKITTVASYQPSDRTYSLDASQIFSDISSLAVVQRLCPQEPTKSSIALLPSLPQQQAENLIARLSNLKVITPRLAIPFQLWGALIEHGGWRYRLYQRRLGLPEQWSILEWLQNGVSQIPQQLGWVTLEMQTSMALARSSEQIPPQTVLSRHLLIAGQAYELRIIPQGDAQQRIWRFELQNATVGVSIPGGFKLRLLSEDLQPFPNNEDIATTAVEKLFVEVALEPGEGLVWEIEPVPDNYDQEILRF
ncbi:MAG: DUF1822 family protein [Nostocaceae cyanobacterium]|nr:DUF1822 family protein [Nostocaceae cyanobacterium]